MSNFIGIDNSIIAIFADVNCTKHYNFNFAMKFSYSIQIVSHGYIRSKCLIVEELILLAYHYKLLSMAQS